MGAAEGLTPFQCPPLPGQERFRCEESEAVAESRRRLCIGLHGEGRQCHPDGPEQGAHSQVPAFCPGSRGCWAEMGPWPGSLFAGWCLWGQDETGVEKRLKHKAFLNLFHKNARAGIEAGLRGCLASLRCEFLVTRTGYCHLAWLFH